MRFARHILLDPYVLLVLMCLLVCQVSEARNQVVIALKTIKAAETGKF